MSGRFDIGHGGSATMSDGSMEFVTVANVDDLPPGALACVDVDGTPITLGNDDGTIYAFGAYCTHQRARLEEGEIEDGAILCPWHASSFDLRTGRPLCAPAIEALTVYPVRVVGADIQVDRVAVRDAAGG